MAGPLLDRRRKYPAFEHSECVLNEKVEESKVVRPRDPVSRYPLRLSYDSLCRLDRDVTQSTALSRASKVQNWLRDSSQVPLVNQDPLLPDDGLLLSGRSVQIESSDPQVSHPFGRDISTLQDLSNRGRASTAHTTISMSDLHLPVIDLSEPSSKRTKLSEKSRHLSKDQSNHEQRAFTSYSKSASRAVPVSLPADGNTNVQTAKTSKTTAAKSAHAADVKCSVQQQQQKQQKQRLVIDLTDDHKAKKPGNEAVFKDKVLNVFPDICDNYVRLLYAKYGRADQNKKSLLVAVQNALDEILANSPYPKRDVSKKRKQMEDSISNEDLQRIREDKTNYYHTVYGLLKEHFHAVSPAMIKDTLIKSKTYLNSYLSLYRHSQAVSNADDYWKLIHRASHKLPPLLEAVLSHELQEAKKIIAEKENAEKKRAQEALEKVVEEEHRLAGTLVECQCCFTEVIPDRTVPCAGDNVHSFCETCIRLRAEAQVGSMQHEMKCFDTSGCQAGFSRSLILKVIGDKLMKKLEDLQQMDEIAKASIDGLEECPFCEFKAICPPVEEDKEFRCLNSDCETISCRLCKQETHIPKTCKEAKKERGVKERHAVEEAMSAALIRKCPKCGLALVKEGGCNKLTCRCGALICDVCKKDITVVGYEHFGKGPWKGPCNLHELDMGAKRQTDEVIQAETAAMVNVLAQDQNIDPEMVRVTPKSSTVVFQQVRVPNLTREPQIIQWQPNHLLPMGQMPIAPRLPRIPQVQFQVQVPRMPPPPPPQPSQHLQNYPNHNAINPIVLPQAPPTIEIHHLLHVYNQAGNLPRAPHPVVGPATLLTHPRHQVPVNRNSQAALGGPATATQLPPPPPITRSSSFTAPTGQQPQTFPTGPTLDAALRRQQQQSFRRSSRTQATHAVTQPSATLQRSNTMPTVRPGTNQQQTDYRLNDNHQYLRK